MLGVDLMLKTSDKLNNLNSVDTPIFKVRKKTDGDITGPSSASLSDFSDKDSTLLSISNFFQNKDLLSTGNSRVFKIE